MTSKEISPMNQAYQEVPKAWYELDHRTHMALTVVAALVFYNVDKEFLGIDTLPAHLMGAAIYAIGTLADRYSTVQAMKANNQAVENGINTNSSEQNIVLSDITDPKEFMLSKRALTIDIIGLTFSAIYPAIGVGWSVGKIQATANNLRISKRINRAVEIKQSRSKSFPQTTSS